MDINDIAAGIGSSPALQDLAGKLGIAPDQARSALAGVLQHVSSGQGLENVVEQVAARAGIDRAQVQAFLPSVIGLLQGHAQTAPAGAQDALSGLVSSLEGGLLSGLDANKDGSVVDDAMGLVRGIFSGKE